MTCSLVKIYEPRKKNQISSFKQNFKQHALEKSNHQVTLHYKCSQQRQSHHSNDLSLVFHIIEIALFWREKNIHHKDIAGILDPLNQNVFNWSNMLSAQHRVDFWKKRHPYSYRCQFSRASIRRVDSYSYSAWFMLHSFSRGKQIELS